MDDKCPGASFLRTPTLKIKNCPECGSEVEIFSTDVRIKCRKCGFEIYNNIESCIHSCPQAKDCIGEELYNKLKRPDNVSTDTSETG
jgi:ribosomal protein S27AE